MSSVFKKLSILFCIIFMQSWRITSPVSVYYSDYNSRDIFDMDVNDYFDYNLPKTAILDQKQYLNEANNNEVIYNSNIAKQNTASAENQPATTCFPVTTTPQANQTTTTCIPVTTTPNGKQSKTTSSVVTSPPTRKEPTTTFSPVTPPSKAQTDYIVGHILRTIKSMRAHATALITDMNILEKDLCGSSSTDLDAIRTSSTFSGEKIVYPDVLYQSPGYLMNEWSVPVLKNVPQTNQFVEQAQEAVKSWKQQIENCKRILDNAVHNALSKTNLTSDIIKDPLQKSKPQDISCNTKLPANMEEDNKDLQGLTVNKKYRYYGLYDALDTKFDDY